MVRVLSPLFAVATAALAGLFSASAASTTKLYGVDYNIRSGPDWAPDATKCKSADVIAAELAKLKQITDIVRLYSMTDCDQAAVVLPLAIKAGLKVSLGIWVGPENQTFDADKARLEELMVQDGLITTENVEAIYVGSEAMYRGDVNATVAIENIKAVKSLCTSKSLDIPITLADTTEAIIKNPSTIAAVDFVSPNVFPFWDRITPDKAPAQLYGKLEKLMKLTKGKEIVIGETGWATDGVDARSSKATIANAQTYFEGFLKLAQEKNLKYYYFAGFDESWKLATLSADNVEAHFGIFDKDGNLKQPYHSLQPLLDADASSSSASQVGDVGSDSDSGSADAGDDEDSSSSSPAGSSTVSTTISMDAIIASADSTSKGAGAMEVKVPGSASAATVAVQSPSASASDDDDDDDDDSEATGSTEDLASKTAASAVATASNKRKDCHA
uniref:glucan endo-1,3-beta-D-glucosidase n=1 Tax=Globisporangium ultimum (strain ATCC 200006 / CBS 805.95 / DAOM BR144) TaxID=431595 RepID=K3WMY3_GLOUD